MSREDNESEISFGENENASLNKAEKDVVREREEIAEIEKKDR